MNEQTTKLQTDKEREKYEEELINRYSAWEQELTEREAALRELQNR